MRTGAFKIYSKPNCPYCDKAKALLAQHQAIVCEFDCSDETNKWALKSQGFTTVPQIWFGDEYIGGFDSLEKWVEVNKGRI